MLRREKPKAKPQQAVKKPAKQNAKPKAAKSAKRSRAAAEKTNGIAIERSTPGTVDSKAAATTPTKGTDHKLSTAFPFWARLKISKRRTTLVIDEAPAKNKTKQLVPGYVHREATHTNGKNFEEINPNPDKTDPRPMYLKRPRCLPQKLFEPHNKPLDMPEELLKRYEGNNRKKDNNDSGDKKT